jgi:hypothetical protein
MRPLEVANLHHAVLSSFITARGRATLSLEVAGNTDNVRHRNGALDMQANLSSVMAR